MKNHTRHQMDLAPITKWSRPTQESCFRTNWPPKLPPMLQCSRASCEHISMVPVPCTGLIHKRDHRSLRRCVPSLPRRHDVRPFSPSSVSASLPVSGWTLVSIRPHTAFGPREQRARGIESVPRAWIRLEIAARVAEERGGGRRKRTGRRGGRWGEVWKMRRMRMYELGPEDERERGLEMYPGR